MSWMRALILVPVDREHKTVKDVTEVTGMRTIAVVGWLGIVTALLIWQGIGLVHCPEWPTLSDFFRSFRAVRSPVPPVRALAELAPVHPRVVLRP
jgi:hypothetical protein